MLEPLGRFVVRHARATLVVALAVLAGFVVVGIGVFGKLITDGFDDPDSGSSQAAELLADAGSDGADLVLLVTVEDGTVDDPEAAAAGTALTQDVAAVPGIGQVASYWSTAAPPMRSADGAAALITVEPGDATVEHLVEEFSGTRDNLEITPGGGEVIGMNFESQLEQDLLVAESIAVPLVLILLLVVFGSLVSALLPLVVAVFAVFGSFTQLALLAEVTDVSIYAVNLITGLGLGLAVDYALLVVSRFREQLATGQDVGDAVVATVRTAGRTIVFSGMAVAAAMSVLLIFPLAFLRSFAYAGAGVVVVSVLAAVIVLPALLTVLGHRVNAGRLPWARNLSGAASPRWGRLAAAVMARPARFALPAVVVLGVLAVPALGVQFGLADDRVLSTSADGRIVGDALRDDFPAGEGNVIDLVSTAPMTDDELRDYADGVSAVPGVDRVTSRLGVHGDGALVATEPGETPPGLPGELVTAFSPLDPSSDAGRDLVGQVRDVDVPADTTVHVGGASAELVDSLGAISDRLPVALLLVAATAFVVLFLFTGSVVQPLRALVSNVMVLGGVIGLLTWVFQDGNGASVLGFTAMPLDASMLVLFAVIAFGLSMDYEVFVMSRITEGYDAGLSVRAATEQGLARTGRIVSAAAALIAVSFFAFMTSGISFMQMFGMGTGLAILLDATVVRGVLVPASMRALGRHAWYAPGFLRRVHGRVGVRESAEAPGEHVSATVDA